MGKDRSERRKTQQQAGKLKRLQKNTEGESTTTKKENNKWRELAIVKVLKTIIYIAGAIVTFIAIYEFFLKSPRTKFEEDNIITGEVKSPRISEHLAPAENPGKNNESQPNFYYNTKTYRDPIVKGIHVENLMNMPELNFKIGNNIVAINTERLYKGTTILNEIYAYACAGIELKVAAKEDRLYVSSKFVDIETGHEMGEMEYNHWILYRPNFMDYYCNDKSFEVRDPQGDVAFSISFNDNKSMPFVSISGYFTDKVSALVLNPGTNNGFSCFSKDDPGWKRRAGREIGKIQRAVTTRCE